MKTGVINVKFIIYSIVISIIISIIAGIIGNVPFFIFLLRLIFGAVIFAALGAAVAFVLEKYIPEVFNKEEERNEDEERSDETPIEGEEINIVIEEENPHKSSKIGRASCRERV